MTGCHCCLVLAGRPAKLGSILSGHTDAPRRHTRRTVAARSERMTRRRNFNKSIIKATIPAAHSKSESENYKLAYSGLLDWVAEKGTKALWIQKSCSQNIIVPLAWIKVGIFDLRTYFPIQRWSVRLNPRTCAIFWWHCRLLLWDWADLVIQVPSSSCSCGLKQKNQGLLCELLLHHFNMLGSIRRPIVNIFIWSPSNTYINSLQQFIKSPQ